MSRPPRFVAAVALVALSAAAALAPAPASGERIRFVFTADSRSETPTVKPVEPIDLINTPVLGAIRDQILALSPRPQFVVFGGDMAYRGEYDGKFTFATFKDFFAKPLADGGIKTYTVVGNHELYKHPSTGGFWHANQVEFQKTFTENPGNGLPGHERLDYSFHSPGGEAFFAVLDAYYLTADAPSAEDPENDNGTITDSQRAWLESQIAATGATHKFLFVHAPYYTPWDPPPKHYQDATYTKLWKVIDDARFAMYFAGHVHLYSRKTVDATVPPTPQLDPPVVWKNPIVQAITGTAGAGPDKTSPPVDASWHVSTGADNYYFTVVDIDGPVVTVTSYIGNTGAYKAFDYYVLGANGATTAIPALSTPLLAVCGALVLLSAWVALRRRPNRPPPRVPERRA